MPVTGCPSSSSSDEDESGASDFELTQVQVPLNAGGSAANLVGLGGVYGAQPARGAAKLGSLVASNGNISMISNKSQLLNRMSGHRYSDYDEPYQAQQQQQSRVSPRQSFQHTNQMNLPTTISITAPSPMGSMREVNRTSADSQTLESQLMSRKNLQQQQHANEDQIVEMALQMSINTNYRQQQRNSTAGVNVGVNLNNNYRDYTSDQCDPDDENLEQDVGLRDYRGQLDLANSNQSQPVHDKETDKSRSQLIDELLKTINDDNFNEIVDYNNRFVAQTNNQSAMELANQSRPRSAIDGGFQSQKNTKNKSPTGSMYSPSLNQTSGNQVNQANSRQQPQTRPRTLNLDQTNANSTTRTTSTTPSTFDNVIRRMSTNLVQNFNKMSGTNIGAASDQQQAPQSETHVRREKSSNYTNSLYVDNQVPARRHSDNTINIPRIQVALSSPQPGGSRANLNQRASASASKLANKWKLTTKNNQRESTDKLSPNLSSALGYMRRHSSGNTTGNDGASSGGHSNGHNSFLHLHTSASPFKTRSSSNLGLDFLLSNRSMKRRCSAASMLGHQTQRKAENLIDAGMKSVQNMFG